MFLKHFDANWLKIETKRVKLDLPVAGILGFHFKDFLEFFWPIFLEFCKSLSFLPLIFFFLGDVQKKPGILI